MFAAVRRAPAYFAAALAICLATATTACLAANGSPGTVEASNILDQVKKQGYVQCGSVSRPGLADAEKNEWHGLEVEMCRAVAIATLGPNARFAYHEYESERDFEPLRKGGDQIAFLTVPELRSQKLVDQVVLGPAVYSLPDLAMVPVGSPLHQTKDIAGKRVCFFIGSSAEDALNTYLQRNHLDVIRTPFSEEGEMMDAYNVGRCEVVVGEAPKLAEARLHGGIHHLRSRMLPEPIGENRIFAVTPLRGDARWAALVAWTIETLHHLDGALTGPRLSTGQGFGLEAGWEGTVRDKVGSYEAIFNRTLGSRTPLQLGSTCCSR